MNPLDFPHRVVVIAPGDALPYDEAQWRDAIVTVEAGQIELEGVAGGRCRFSRGALLTLAGLPLRTLHNHGCADAVLLAVSRDRTDRAEEEGALT
jgi:hypothetical protein